MSQELEPCDDVNRQSTLVKTDVTPGDSSTVRDRHSAVEIARLLIERGLPNQRGGLIIWAWILATPLLWAALFVAWLSADLNVTLGFLAALLTGRALSGSSKRASESRAALLLPELDQDWLEALVDGLAHPDHAVRAICRLRLITVLPLVGPDAASRLTSDRRAALFEKLTPWEAHLNPDFIGAILRFSAKLGDEGALAGTDYLASMIGFTPALRRVRAEARRCLPALESRVAEHAVEGPALPRRQDASRSIPDRTAGELSPEVRALLDEIEGAASRRPGMRFGFLVACWAAVLPYTTYQIIYQLRHGNIWLAIVFAVALACSTQLHRLTLMPQQTQLAARLAAVDDLQAVGPLTEMLSWPDDRLKSMAISALTRLLPRLKGSDSHFLSPAQRVLLYQALDLKNAGRYGEFLIAVLAALEQVGDVDALRVVETLAESEPRTLRQRRVVEAATECLPYLQNCAQNNMQSQTLLRAVCDSGHESNLLRPAANSLDINAELLLRSTQSPDTV